MPEPEDGGISLDDLDDDSSTGALLGLDDDDDDEDADDEPLGVPDDEGADELTLEEAMAVVRRQAPEALAGQRAAAPAAEAPEPKHQSYSDVLIGNVRRMDGLVERMVREIRAELPDMPADAIEAFRDSMRGETVTLEHLEAYNSTKEHLRAAKAWAYDNMPKGDGRRRPANQPLARGDAPTARTAAPVAFADKETSRAAEKLASKLGIPVAELAKSGYMPKGRTR